MTEAFATANGRACTSVKLTVTNVGPWYAELDLEDASELGATVILQLGPSLVLLGTVVAPQSGTHLAQRKCRIVAGAGGWGRTPRPKSYHNDALVRVRLVAEDIAREVGEVLGTFIPAAERVGRDYVRDANRPASAVLEDVIGGVAWWVDYSGITHVGPRPASALRVSAYDVLAYDPRARVLTFAVDDPGVVQIGAVLSTPPLEGPQTIREYEVHVTEEGMRVVAWCGGSEREPGRIAGLMRAIARRSTDDALYGKYRYRVIKMRADGRVELQAVRKAAGMPDVQPLSQWPGVAGAHAELAPGTEVLVEFIEGDRSQPIITGYTGKGGPAFSPVELAFCESTLRAARQGDLVQSGGVGTVVVLQPVTGVGAPPNNAVVAGVPHLISFASTPTDQAGIATGAKPLYGAISTGSPKVRT
jgi:hypothetical protein